MRGNLLPALLLATACAHSGPGGASSPPFDEVSMERTTCFGTCPAYTVVVRGDGKITYTGHHYVKVVGPSSSWLAPSARIALAEAFEKAGYFSMQDEYANVNPTDFPWVKLSFKGGGREKAINHYTADSSAPAALDLLEQDFDRIVEIEQFIGTSNQRRNLMRCGIPSWN
jgi:hypothetical protein